MESLASKDRRHGLPMNVLIIRHAIAFERDRHRWRDDTERPLSPAGIRSARKAAAGIRQLVKPPQRVLTSPLVRARQTAQILTDIAGWPHASECAELSPGGPLPRVFAALNRERNEQIAIVGHQPDLGLLLAACLMGDAGPVSIELKKFAVACVSFNAIPRAGRGVLRWLATPRMLRALRAS
jgi:phosphohistidine phosphatase